MKYKQSTTRKAMPKRNALVVALAVGMGISGLAFGQATTGTIFGSAPAGDTVVVSGGAGIHRVLTVGADGTYSATVPVGVYTVTLKSNGAVMRTRNNVSPAAGRGAEVDFVAAKSLSAVTVTANALPAIDVSSAAQQTTVTAQQLERLPLGRSAAAIALLAPGVNLGAAADGNSTLGQALLSFSGATIAENAYYINGMNTTDGIDAQGGLSLPYNSIAQQQTKTFGFSAKYGRAIGGVISQVGKSGTNQWHFGARVLWEPAQLRGTPANYYYKNPRVTTGPTPYGTLYAYKKDDQSWTTTYDLYVGGPIIKDRLFFFVSGEWEKSKSNSVGAISSITPNTFYTTETPKYYGKIDWNITDSNILSGTFLQSSIRQSSVQRTFDPDTHTTGDVFAVNPTVYNKYRMWVLHYTSYITQNLTLNALYGQVEGFLNTTSAQHSSLPYIAGAGLQNPAANGGVPGGIINTQPIEQAATPGHRTRTISKRLSLTYHIGDHNITAGIDNLVYEDLNDGSSATGPGYSWEYGKSPNGPTKPIQGHKGTNGYVGPTGPAGGAEGYYVDKRIFMQGGSFKVKQTAQYVIDNWQVTPRLILNLGLRNDQFTNYNANNIPFISLKSGQIAPRLGASWDVFGDASLKVFATAGRYYLALPPSMALREAAASTYTRQFYTYTSVDSNGIPQGLVQIPTQGYQGGNIIAINKEFGQTKDPRLITAKNIKAEYQDNYSLGAQWQFNPKWVAGLTLRYSKLGRVVDDVYAAGPIESAKLIAKMKAEGFDLSNVKGIPAGPLVNPGGAEQIPIPMNDGSVKYVTMTADDWGFPAKPKRDYWAAQFSLTHPFDGKWFGKIVYVLSRSYGNTEGPIQSNIGQAGSSVSITEQWDFHQIMEYAGGEQANNRTNVIKAYGYFQLTPEWMISGNAYIASGTPASCLGYYGPGQTDPSIGYGDAYHWCGGKPTPPGTTGHTPWRFDLSLGLTYSPAWADHKLGFHVKARNIFNEQEVTQYYPFYGSTSSPAPYYRQSLGFEPVRSVQLSVTYNY